MKTLIILISLFLLSIPQGFSQIRYAEDFEKIDSMTNLPEKWKFKGVGICSLVNYFIHQGDTLKPTSGKHLLFMQNNGSDSAFGELFKVVTVPKGVIKGVTYSFFTYKKKGKPSFGNETDIIRLTPLKSDSVGNVVRLASSFIKIGSISSFPFVVSGGFGSWDKPVFPVVFDTFEISIIRTLRNSRDSGDFVLIDDIALVFDTSQKAIQLKNENLDFSMAGIKIYPNPAQDNLNIELPDHLTTDGIKNLSMICTDLQGRTLRRWPVSNDTKLAINIQDFLPGVYMLGIVHPNGVSWVKWVRM